MDIFSSIQKTGYTGTALNGLGATDPQIAEAWKNGRGWVMLMLADKINVLDNNAVADWIRSVDENNSPGADFVSQAQREVDQYRANPALFTGGVSQPGPSNDLPSPPQPADVVGSWQPKPDTKVKVDVIQEGGKTFVRTPDKTVTEIAKGEPNPSAPIAPAKSNKGLLIFGAVTVGALILSHFLKPSKASVSGLAGPDDADDKKPAPIVSLGNAGKKHVTVKI